MTDHRETARICGILREELCENGYRYGFYLNGRRIVPEPAKGFDAEFGRLLTTEYRVQPPAITKREKVATCLDAVLVMKEILSAHSIGSRIWMIRQRESRKCHAVLTFVIDGTVVYLELTPQSGKENYGKALLFEDEQAFVAYWEEANNLVREITEICVPGEKPDFFLQLPGQ